MKPKNLSFFTRNCQLYFNKLPCQIVAIRGIRYLEDQICDIRFLRFIAFIGDSPTNSSGNDPDSSFALSFPEGVRSAKLFNEKDDVSSFIYEAANPNESFCVKFLRNSKRKIYAIKLDCPISPDFANN